MSKFTGTITGRDYSTYEPAWKTMVKFAEIPFYDPLIAEYGRKTTFSQALEKRFPEWKVREIRTDKAAGMATMDLVPADGSKVKARCDSFSCDLLEVW